MPDDVPRSTVRALVRLAALVTMSQEPQELIEAVAETARELLAADSLSISRLEHPASDAGSVLLLRTLINVGTVAPGEQRWPTNETYRVEDFPDTLGFLLGRPVRHRATHVDDPDAEAAEVALLRALGKQSSLKTPILLGSTVWGELWAARSCAGEAFAEHHGELAEVIVALIAAGLSQADAWQRLQVLAGTDPLTGLANRRAFDEHLRRFLARTTAAGQPCAVAVGDVNGLKHVNDTLGHAAGDDALRQAAQGALSSIGALTDALAGRLGGDEFALVLPGV